jgi:hypothetical protein
MLSGMRTASPAFRDVPASTTLEADERLEVLLTTTWAMTLPARTTERVSPVSSPAALPASM